MYTLNVVSFICPFSVHINSPHCLMADHSTEIVSIYIHNIINLQIIII
uniref:Uncharacterized protein n=1 Tax=Arundo donax TaxID=35708 RepID=A0A0A9FY57_ARUDO